MALGFGLTRLGCLCEASRHSLRSEEAGQVPASVAVVATALAVATKSFTQRHLANDRSRTDTCLTDDSFRLVVDIDPFGTSHETDINYRRRGDVCRRRW